VCLSVCVCVCVCVRARTREHLNNNVCKTSKGGLAYSWHSINISAPPSTTFHPAARLAHAQALDLLSCPGFHSNPTFHGKINNCKKLLISKHTKTFFSRTTAHIGASSCARPQKQFTCISTFHPHMTLCRSPDFQRSRAEGLAQGQGDGKEQSLT